VSFPPPHATIEISPADTAAWLAEEPDSFVLIDCREEDEWNICRLEGARLIPFSRFGELAPNALDLSTPVVLYCHHGMRSAHAATWLREKGFRAWSLTGGIDAWSEGIDPDVPRY
jgi:rhodanese-related sulfurtransferase